MEGRKCQYFAKYEKRLVNAWNKLCELDSHVDKEMWKTFKCYTNHVHISGINDVLFQLRKWLISLGTEVSVEGEGWNLLGIESSGAREGGGIVVIDEECEWIDFAFAEYLNCLENYASGLKARLSKPYTPEMEKKKKVLFYLSYYPYYVESIESLIYQYIQSNVECICVFPSIEGIWREDNLSDDLGRLPLELRSLSQHVVALQETPLYPHMYGRPGLFENVFSEKARQETDYLVAADYMADWICERDKKWEEKMLRFGYPKQDTLYHALNSEVDIPEQWGRRIAGKRVYLFTTYIMEQSWLEFFADKEDNKIAIWRPHPLTLYASFKISNALIAPVHGSLMINYLYTGKPICLYDNEQYELEVIDFREEFWYKSVYSTSNGQEVLEFIKKIEEGIWLSEERELLLKPITSSFDGKVCNRIYDFFKKYE